MTTTVHSEEQPVSDDSLKERAINLLRKADIHLDGPAPTDLKVHDERLFARVFAHGSLGLGEAGGTPMTFPASSPACWPRSWTRT